MALKQGAAGYDWNKEQHGNKEQYGMALKHTRSGMGRLLKQVGLDMGHFRT